VTETDREHLHEFASAPKACKWFIWPQEKLFQVRKLRSKT